MRYALPVLSAAVLAMAGNVRLNQIGFLPHAQKHVVVSLAQSDTFVVKSVPSGSEVMRGVLAPETTWIPSGVKTRIGDLSSLETSGQYQVEVKGAGASRPFRIGNDALNDAFYHTLRGFFYWRVGPAIDSVHGGRFARAAGHPDSSLPFHPDLGKDTTLRWDARGGWYDAGDYGKYIVNAGVSTGTLLLLAEMNPDLVPDNFSNIPESGNGVSDLLDEIRWELDWFLRMQDSDSSVFFKVTPKSFESTVLPAVATKQRYVIGKSTSSALNFAAVLAQASRIYRAIDPAFADTCLVRARRAYNWAKAHPSMRYTQGSGSTLYKDVSTGGYGDNNFKTEFFWAAAELWLATGSASYRSDIDTYAPTSAYAPGWGDPGSLGIFSLAISGSSRDAALAGSMRTMVKTAADNLVAMIAKNPWKVYDINFNWGSNGLVASTAISLVVAARLESDAAYLDAAGELLDYLLGKNPNDMVFVTGIGDRGARSPHARILQADGIADPIPGYLVGGPNSGTGSGDGALTTYQQSGCAEAVCWLDVSGSFASNEIAINWNAPLVFLLGSMIAGVSEQGSLQALQGPFVVTTSAQGPGAISVTPSKSNYAAGEQIHVVATPSAGARFAYWTEGLFATNADTVLTVDADMRLTAWFDKDGEELLRNNGFSEATRWWMVTATNSMADASGMDAYARGAISADSQGMLIDPVFPGAYPQQIALFQPEVQVTIGQKYRVFLRAKASAARTAKVVVRVGAINFVVKQLTLGTTLSEYHFTFSVTSANTELAEFRLEAGGDSSKVLVDSVSMRVLAADAPAESDVLTPILAVAPGQWETGSLRLTSSEGFVWASVPAAGRYRVTVRNMAGQVLSEVARDLPAGATRIARVENGICVVTLADGTQAVSTLTVGP